MRDKGTSYTSRSSWVTLLEQARYLSASLSSDIPGQVRGSIDDARLAERRIDEAFGIRLRGLDVLEIGPGQHLSQMTYFSEHNRTVGIDLDVIAYGNDLATYWRMFRTNGAQRVIKTVGRKSLGIDARYRAELRRQLGLQKTPSYTVLQMDASQMRLPDASFDLVYSRSVFQCVPDPGKAMREIVRVLRPGGAAYITLHPYTSPTGCLDPRIYYGQADSLGWWPHLRPELRGLVHSNVYTNQLRVPEWKRLFQAEMPGAEFVLTPCEDRMIDEARALHAADELRDFSVEELTTGRLVAMWRK